jgi:hypothetical protein
MRQNMSIDTVPLQGSHFGQGRLRAGAESKA